LRRKSAREVCTLRLLQSSCCRLVPEKKSGLGTPERQDECLRTNTRQTRASADRKPLETSQIGGGRSPPQSERQSAEDNLADGESRQRRFSAARVCRPTTDSSYLFRTSSRLLVDRLMASSSSVRTRTTAAANVAGVSAIRR